MLGIGREMCNRVFKMCLNKFKVCVYLICYLCIFAELSSTVSCLQVEDEIVHTPEEIQHAVCKIATTDIQASANATITRQLKGVCSARELDKKLTHLEKVLMKEVDTIKQMLESIGAKIVISQAKSYSITENLPDYDSDYEDEDYANEIIQKVGTLERKSNQDSPMKIVHLKPNLEALRVSNESKILDVKAPNEPRTLNDPGTINAPRTSSDPRTLDGSKIIEGTQIFNESFRETNYLEETTNPEKVPNRTIEGTRILMNEPSNAVEIQAVHQQQFEEETNVVDKQIKKFNTTVQTLGLGRVFYYYWRIHGINKILGVEDVPLHSPEFNFNGHLLRMKLTPHQFGSNYINIELKGAFTNKHRFTILDQQDSKNDITSQMLGNLENYAKAYRITHTKLNNFIVKDELLIKLLIYVDL